MKKGSELRYTKQFISTRSPNTTIKGVKHISFLPSDLVLRKVTLSTKEPNAGKLSPTWEDPYKVVKVSRTETYWLEDMGKKPFPRPWNAEHLKIYYQ